MESKVFLITGASTGIGEATARRAIEAGFRIMWGAKASRPASTHLQPPCERHDRRCPVAMEH